MKRQGFLAWGVGLWAVGTAVLRVRGELLLPESGPARLLALALGVVGGALLCDALFRLAPATGERAAAAAWLVLPTLLLDSLSSAFFPQLFAGVDAGRAGIFSGLMMASCAGALLRGAVPGRG